jgi:uncharacterized protein YdgA (DUF945 family)
MKKSVGIGAGVAVVVVVAAGAWVGTTWYTGKRIEASSAQKLEEANAFLTAKYPYLGLKLTADRYERGVFSTNARYVLISSVSPDPAKPIRIDVDTRIDHGPFPGTLAPHLARVHSSIAQNETTKPVFDITKGASPLVADALVAYGGDTKYDWAMPAVEYAKDSRSISFSGAKGAGTVERDTLAVKGDMRVDLIKIQGAEAEDKANVEMHGIGGKMDTRQGKFGLSIGEAEMTLDRLVVTTKNPKLGGSLDKGSYRVKIGENDKFLNVEAAYAAGAMKVGTVDLGSAQLVVKGGQLDGASLKAMSDFYGKLPGVMALGATDPKNADMMNSGIMTMMGSGQQLLAANPTFSIEPMLWKTDKGEQRASLNVTFDRFPIEQGQARDMAIKAIKRLEASFSFSKLMAQDLATRLLVEQQGATPAEAQKMAAEQIEQVVAMAQMMNLGKVEGDNLVTRVVYADGVIDVNGTKTPVDEFADQLGVGKSWDQSSEEEPAVDDEEVDIEDETEADEAVPADEAGTPAVVSGNNLNRVNTDILGDILDDEGYSYTVDTDSAGDPKIDIEPGETGAKSIEVEYYNCSARGKNCEDFLMKATFKPSRGATLKLINGFNRENRWVRVYLDDDNSPVVEMDVNADGGLGKKSLKILVGLFFSVTKDFAEEIKTAAPAPRSR